MLIWLAAIVTVVVLYSARYRVLRKIGRFRVVDDGQPSCDAIVILNGNISTRTYRAVDLYKWHRAPVLIARLADTEEVRIGVIPNISDATRELLLRRGGGRRRYRGPRLGQLDRRHGATRIQSQTEPLPARSVI